MDFFNQHNSKFSDADENKLEYTTIHEEYISIVEEAIESKLTLDFSQEQIDSFYKDFQQNPKKYQEID